MKSTAAGSYTIPILSRIRKLNKAGRKLARKVAPLLETSPYLDDDTQEEEDAHSPTHTWHTYYILVHLSTPNC